MAAITGTITGESTTGTVDMKTSADVTLNDCPDFVIEGGSYVTDMNGMKWMDRLSSPSPVPSSKAVSAARPSKAPAATVSLWGEGTADGKTLSDAQGVPVETLFMRRMTATAQG
ncbi:hypothetical protein [Faecalibaculum rodentium]|uniref:hypothetical protein n=1 Tax=Faecalibaculum rodentium TaxID=1702221 RepID=UPI00263691F7|nr:hypothetical protein [Faecalibaculum rodentium]